MKAYKYYLIESMFIVLMPAIIAIKVFFPSYLRAFHQIPWVMFSWIVLLPGLVFFGFTIFPTRGKDVYRMIKDMRKGDIISKEGTVRDYKIQKRFNIMSGQSYELAIREKDTGLTKIYTGMVKDLDVDIQLNDNVEIQFMRSAEIITNVVKLVMVEQ